MRHRPVVLTAVFGLVLGLAPRLGSQAPAVTVTPSQRDYGRTVLKGSSLQEFAVTSAVGDAFDVSIVGPNAVDFTINGPDRQSARIGPCVDTNTGRTLATCRLDVDFRPQSAGTKTATLVVTTTRGRATAALRGEAVSGTYSGSFSWQSDLNGPYGQNKKAITVTVVNGQATCDGTETDVTISKLDKVYVTTETGSIQGRGLIAITRESEDGKPAYRIAVSCPSPAWPTSVNRPGEPARPSQPAEWGSSYAEETYLQPLPPPAANGVLSGSRSVAHPDTDSANGVTGTMSVSWRLTPS